jgi:hypothetical protein
MEAGILQNLYKATRNRIHQDNICFTKIVNVLLKATGYMKILQGVAGKGFSAHLPPCRNVWLRITGVVLLSKIKV